MHWSTAGESHGKALVALIEGVPAGVEIQIEHIEAALARRRAGYGRGSRQRFEADVLEVLSGVRHGRTLGSPIALTIANSEWPKWNAVMSPLPVSQAELMRSDGRGDQRELARNKRLTKPRPGHADLVGMNKYGFDSVRNVLERASARETAARVALGEIARALLEQAAGIQIVSQVVQIGAYRADVAPASAQEAAELNESSVRQLNLEAAARFVEEIDAAKLAGDTVGGVVEVTAWNVPQGLGTYAVDRERLDARIASAMMSIQSAKGVEIGDGFASAARRGSQAHDDIYREGTVRRRTNRAGGIEGGISNGEAITVRVALKPISTVPRALETIDTDTGGPAIANHQRSDTCAVVPAAVIAEAMLALVLADALLDKCGGDSLEEVRRNLHGFLRSIPEVRR
ncbi:chorismate synthase [Arcanobacterium wilhelmae]|uniref:Chorismate synthase n=1 Tax=Arcanobacterium wilhelmae TaxID=1803177 RepID=A0ABT9N8K4_9ACTO|nr:chorismate synthase [Arcanobacterium wilhelmae]MDP9800037.1 chorismate synthase [Arcanobacterium wilhelmae]WFN89532.1 chorismate synthase [Arcanobacterium wilhelmae]